MEAGPPLRVEVTRGGTVESAHRVSAVLVDGAGAVHWSAGDVDRFCFARSAVKALQALPLVEDGVVAASGMTAEELALCCASHSGEADHVATAARLLARADAAEDALACGPHAPLGTAAARALRAAGERPGRLHNNCSGKHAGMLLLARHHGWPLAGYHLADHPVQARMAVELARWSGLPAAAFERGVDGCGVVTFGLPIRALARALAAFGAAAAAGQPGPAAVTAALRAHPWMVAGTGRPCTDLMEATGGRVLAKVGAEGVYVAWLPERGLGLALKVEDGATRAAAPALLAALAATGLLTESELAVLADHARPALTNTRDERVGEVRAVAPEASR